jgi:hypothetical protein
LRSSASNRLTGNDSGAPRYQPRQARCRSVLGFRTRAQESVALRFVEHQFEVEHRHVVAHPRLQRQQRIPQTGIGVLVDHALEQGNHQCRQIRAGSHRRGRGFEIFLHHSAGACLKIIFFRSSSNFRTARLTVM